MKYLGLDLGSVTCGVSKSDTGLLAQAVKTIRFKPDDYDEALDKIEEYINEYKPDLIVLGYPLLENGDAGPRAKLSEEFKKALEDETKIKVVLQDERSTTKDSEEFLIEADVSRKKRKQIIDQQAAVRILQYYLNSHNNINKNNFDSAMRNIQEWAKSVGYKETDINDIIKTYRKNKNRK